MRLSISKSANKIFYYAIESVRNGNKVTSKIICKIGEYNDLISKGIKDPLQYAKNEIIKINNGLKENKVTTTDTFDCSEIYNAENTVSLPTYKNIGYLYLESIYNQLDLPNYFNQIETKSKYNLTDISEHSIIDRILYPRSKRASYLNKGLYLKEFNYKAHDIYRFLKLLSNNNESLQSFLYKNTAQCIDLDTTVLYYDCTNFYFETEEPDDNIYNDDGDIIQWGLRRYGISKEHRPNPIVQMGLFTDKNGIPISYCVEHGSNNEQNTVIPLERRMIKDYKTSKFIYCSDAGLGSMDNRFFNTLQGRDYIVTHSLKSTKKEDINSIFKDMNWRVFSFDSKDTYKDKAVSIDKFKELWNKKINGEYLTNDEEMLVSHDIIYKMYPLKRTIPASFLKNSNIKILNDIEIEETLYITFSMKYYLYQTDLFNKQLDRAKELLTKDLDKIKKGPADVKRFIKTESLTDNGEIASLKENFLNNDIIEKEKKFHGFYALATSLDLPIEDLLQINSSRWKIEQSFRIMKTDFDARPAYTSTPEGIKGHFAICYIALLIYRILERKLYLSNPLQNNFSSTQVLTTLKNLNVNKMQNGKLYESLYSPSIILLELEKLYHLGLSRKYHHKTSFENKEKNKQ